VRQQIWGEGTFLTGRTARSVIGYWHDDVVCLSVCVSHSVTLCIVAKRYNL